MNSRALPIFQVKALPWLVLLSLFFSPALVAASAVLGGNLTILESDDGRVFIDVFRQIRSWQTRNADGTGDYNTAKAEKMPVDADGWPRMVPFDPGDGSPLQRPHTLFTARGQGTYQLRVEGRGRLRFTSDNKLLDPRNDFLNSVDFVAAGGAQTFEVVFRTDARQFVFVDVLESDAADPLRNIRLIPPGIADENGPTGPFLPEYLESVSRFRVLRFMVQGQINSSPLKHWDARSRTTTYSQLSAAGMAYEFMFDLANRTHRPAWVCIPHQADDDFVRHLAQLARLSLDPGLKLFLEYSNETWNYSPGFEQSNYVTQQGQAAGLDPDQFVARRSAQIWRIFEEEFASESANRLVKVMASQAANDGISRRRLVALGNPEINPGGAGADVLAIAPYFGGSVADSLVAAGPSSDITIDQILEAATQGLRGETTAWTLSQAAIAKEYGVWLVDYEAGQHLVSNLHPKDDVLTSKLIAANRSPRMGDLYAEYLDRQSAAGVALTCLFAHVSSPSEYGSWGLLENLSQSPTEAPKWSAFLTWQASHPPQNLPPRADAGPDQNVFATGSEGLRAVKLDGSGSRDLDGTVARYEWRKSGAVVATGMRPELSLPLGRSELELTITDDAGATSTDVVLVNVAPSAAAGTVLATDFSGTSPALRLPWTGVAKLDPNVTWSGIRASPNVRRVEGDNHLEFWVAGSESGQVETLTAARQADEYFSWSVAPREGYRLDLRGATLQFRWRRLSFHAPRRWGIYTRIGGFATGQELAVTETTESVDESLVVSVTLPLDGFGDLSSAVEFRLYPFGEQFHNHHAALEKVTLGGAAVSVVPAIRINRSSGGVELRWPDGPFRLRTSTRLDDVASWQVVAEAPTREGSMNILPQPVGGEERYYRLEPE